jgi:hypothetical protein
MVDVVRLLEARENQIIEQARNQRSDMVGKLFMPSEIKRSKVL